MVRKLLTVCIAFALLALPAVASASPVLTDAKGTVAAGAAIEAVQLEGTHFTSTDGTRTLLLCSTGTMKGTVVTNANNVIEGKITSAVFGGTGQQATGEPAPECTGELSFGNVSITGLVSEKAPWCIRSTGEDKFSISGGGCPGGGTLKFLTVTTIAGTCEYESTGPIGGTYNTGGSFAELVFANTAHTSGSVENGFKLLNTSNAFCPTSYSLDMKFTLRTAGTTEDLTIS